MLASRFLVIASSSITRRDDGILLNGSVTELLLNPGISEQLHLYLHTLRLSLQNEQRRIRHKQWPPIAMPCEGHRRIADTVEKVPFMLVN